MKDLLTHLGCSRQAMHQGYRRMQQLSTDVAKTVELATAVRKDHPGMCSRDMYYCERINMPRGRDWTEQTLLDHGFALQRRSKSFTQAGTNFKENLIEGMPVTGPNQLWQTDITYVWAGKRWYYASFMLDVFNRKIIAVHLSKNLGSQSQLELVKKAVKTCSKQALKHLIIHTDRGTQYTSDAYGQWLSKKGIRLSMARYAYENAYCERVHRTIKHNYLQYYTYNTFEQLQSRLKKAVTMYNTSKPHRSLPNRLSPNTFEQEYIQGKYNDYSVKIWSKLTSTKQLIIN